jgi:ADP-ribose pyrophosphatase
MDSGPSGRNLSWELVDSREDRDYNFFKVFRNRNRSPRTGKIYEFQVLKSPDSVTVLPITAGNELVMVRQYRHGIGQLSLEPPGGLVKEGQTPEQSGREELEEETGYQTGTLRYLGWMYPLPAVFANRLHVFVAEDVKLTGTRNPDETEEVETLLIPISQVKDYIRQGKVTCGAMIAALYLFFDRYAAPGSEK